MNEEQRNKQVIQELDGMMLDLYSDVVFDPNVERNTYYPVALQIAKHITAKEYKEFRLTYAKFMPYYYEKASYASTLASCQEGGIESRCCTGLIMLDGWEIEDHYPWKYK